jgi:ribosomal protein S18 acetylase RimI-like enzyme
MIKIITDPSWQEYKALRLEALKNEPQAFSSVYEDEANFNDKKWKQRLSGFSDRTNNIMVFAVDGKKLVGMTGVFWGGSEKTKHIATIFGVYVKKEYRGKGIGKLLLENIIKQIDSLKQIKKIKLSVTASQLPALSLYKKMGFELIGKSKNEIKVNGVYYDEYHLEKLKK